MHLIEQYALSCGVKIGKPHIETSFFPIPFKKYITLHASSGMEAKNYDYFPDVMTLISPYLKEEGIEVVQVGAKEDKAVKECNHYNGNTSIRQTAYVIEKSLLHFGNDSFTTHVASGFNKKLVCLYSVLYKECCGPYWGDKNNQILIESDRGGLKPSFSSKESPKTINFIKPETIARSVLNLLNIKHNIDSVETLHMGVEYKTPSISVVPNHIMPKTFAKGQPVNIWGHECFDQPNIAKWAYDRKCNIFLDQPMELKYLRVIKDNINLINYYVSEKDNPKYFTAIEKLGIKLNLLCKNEENINELRIKFFDWPIMFIKTKTKKDLDNSNKVCDNTRYKCSMKIIAGGQIYNSKAAWKYDKQGNHNKIIDCPEFWEDLNILRIYNENNHGNKDKTN